MTTPSVGAIGFSDVNTELGKASNAAITLNDANVRELAGPTFLNPSTAISLNDLRGKTALVKSGLILHLDAANYNSYAGSGSTWTDLSGNNNNVTLTNSPTWNSSGYFSTGSTGYFTGSGTASVPTGNASYTMMCWVRLGSWSSGRGMISIGGFGVTNQSNALRTADSGTLGHLIHYWWANDLTASNNNGGISTNVWFLVTAQFDGTNRRIWVNTTNVASNTPSGHNVTSTTIQVAKTYASEYLQGDIAAAYIYNRALSSSEITQNYNALRGRFGL